VARGRWFGDFLVIKPSGFDLDASCALFADTKEPGDLFISSNGSRAVLVTPAVTTWTTKVITVIQAAYHQLHHHRPAFCAEQFPQAGFWEYPAHRCVVRGGRQPRLTRFLPATTLPATFTNHVSMVLGVFTNAGEWKFNAIGEANPRQRLQELVRCVRQWYIMRYLNLRA